MKKDQSNPQETKKTDLESRWDDEEEITVRKNVKDLENEPETVEEMADQQDSEDFEALYKATLDELKEEKANYLRQVAEFENFRKRLAKEKEDLVKFGNSKVLEDIFPTLDNLEMTLSHASEEQLKKDPVISGVGMVYKELLKTLAQHGLEEISGEGEVFDPNKQEAIGTRAVDGVDSNIVVEVHRKGYSLHGRVIRAAMVTVSE